MSKISRRNAAIAAFFLFGTLFCVFMVLLLLSGSAQVDALPSVQVLADPQEEYLPLLFKGHDGNAVLVCSGTESTFLLRLDSSTGKVLLENEVPTLAFWAVLRSNRLFVLEYSETDTFLTAYDINTFAQTACHSLSFPLDQLLYFDCDSTGTVYYALSDSPAVLQILFSDGTEATQEFPESVEYLETAEDGSLLIFAGEKLFYARQGEDFQEIPCLAPPCKRLNDMLIIDQDGIISALKSDEAGIFLSPLFRCSEQLTDTFSFCLDGENCLVLSNGSTVLRYDLDGQNQGSCHVTSAPLAVCSVGTLLREKDGLYYSAFPFWEGEKDTETPSSLASPRPTTTLFPSLNSSLPQEAPPLEVEGQYILMPAGTTAMELREYFMPEAVKICDLTGKQITQGQLATGMTADDWFVVIKGDCNGTGTVTSADLRAALTLFLDSPLVTDAASRAADLNDNGEIDTDDLLQLSRLAAK